MIRLHLNENPHGVLPPVRHRIAECLMQMELAHYPDDGARQLRAALGRYAGVSPDRIVVGNGSDELLQLILLSLSPRLQRVVIPVPTFGMYRAAAELAGLDVIEVPLVDGFDLDVTAVLREVSAAPAALFICYPNNPTGNYFSCRAVNEVSRSAAEIIVVDEAYYEFGGRSRIAATERDPRIIVTRTLSKAFGLASMRVGYLVAHQEVVRILHRSRQPFNTSAAAQVAARVVVEEAQAQLATVGAIVGRRRWLMEELRGISGLFPLPSEANFLLVRVEQSIFGMTAGELCVRLREGGIAIRCFSGVNHLTDCVRISVGTTHECGLLIEQIGGLRRGGG
ncbi:MAG: histidinol-phosphate transaminase [Bacillota bacterium]